MAGSGKDTSIVRAPHDVYLMHVGMKQSMPFTFLYKKPTATQRSGHSANYFCDNAALIEKTIYCRTIKAGMQHGSIGFVAEWGPYSWRLFFSDAYADMHVAEC